MESSVGYSFLASYQDCKRRWYLGYGLSLTPESKAKALDFGDSIHEGFKGYYASGRNPDMLIAGYKERMETLQPSYNPEYYAKDLARGYGLLATWLKTWHELDVCRYDVIEFEVEHAIPLPGSPFSLTIKPDLFVYDRDTGEHYLFDHKTTSWSVGQAFSQVDAQDQATAYIWGMRKLGHRVQGLIPDVLYNKGSVFKAERPGVVYRTDADLAEWENEASGLLGDLTQRMEAATSGVYPIRHLFPRNGSLCARYGCAFTDICRTQVTPGDLPIGFIRRESHDPGSVTS